MIIKEELVEVQTIVYSGEWETREGTVPTLVGVCPYCGHATHIASHTGQPVRTCDHMDGYRGQQKSIRTIIFTKEIH